MFPKLTLNNRVAWTFTWKKPLELDLRCEPLPEVEENGGGEVQFSHNIFPDEKGGSSYRLLKSEITYAPGDDSVANNGYQSLAGNGQNLSSTQKAWKSVKGFFSKH